MKLIVSAICLLFNISIFASEIRITFWDVLNISNDRDRAAEVCFKVIPAPTKLTHARITIDKNSRNEAYYNAFIDEKGSTCLVVSSVLGRVEIFIPELNLTSNLNSLIKN